MPTERSLKYRDLPPGVQDEIERMYPAPPPPDVSVGVGNFGNAYREWLNGLSTNEKIKLFESEIEKNRESDPTFADALQRKIDAFRSGREDPTAQSPGPVLPSYQGFAGGGDVKSMLAGAYPDDIRDMFRDPAIDTRGFSPMPTVPPMEDSQPSLRKPEERQRPRPYLDERVGEALPFNALGAGKSAADILHETYGRAQEGDWHGVADRLPFLMQILAGVRSGRGATKLDDVVMAHNLDRKVWDAPLTPFPRDPGVTGGMGHYGDAASLGIRPGTQSAKDPTLTGREYRDELSDALQRRRDVEQSIIDSYGLKANPWFRKEMADFLHRALNQRELEMYDAADKAQSHQYHEPIIRGTYAPKTPAND